MGLKNGFFSAEHLAVEHHRRPESQPGTKITAFCISFAWSRSLCSLLPRRINQHCASYLRTTSITKYRVVGCLIRKRGFVSRQHGKYELAPAVAKIRQ